MMCMSLFFVAAISALKVIFERSNRSHVFKCLPPFEDLNKTIKDEC